MFKNERFDFNKTVDTKMGGEAPKWAGQICQKDGQMKGFEKPIYFLRLNRAKAFLSYFQERHSCL